jgi:hypothetical protein
MKKELNNRFSLAQKSMADPKEPRRSNQACLRPPRPVDDDNLSPNSRLTVSRNKRNNLKGPGSSLGCVLYLEIRLALSDNQSGSDHVQPKMSSLTQGFATGTPLRLAEYRNY